MPDGSIDRDNADLLLTTTRTVRKRLDLKRPVEPEVIAECLEIALQAPVGSNLQRWRWLVVTDDGKRAALGDLYRRAITPYNDIMERVVEASGVDAGRLIGSTRHLENVIDEVPVLVVPCVLGAPDEMGTMLGAAGFPFEISDNLAASSFYGSIWPAVWSFMLALRTRGLGAALTTMHLALEREAGEILGIPDTVTQIGLLPVAYYTGTDFRPAKRRPAEQITYWNAWKDTARPR